MVEDPQRAQPEKPDDNKQSRVQSKLLGLPENEAEEAIEESGNSRLIELAYACAPAAAAAGPDFSRATRPGGPDEKGRAGWQRLQRTPDAIGGMDSLTKALGESAIERLKALDEDFVDSGRDPVRALRANIIHLRMKELGDNTTGYLTPELKKFDHAFTAVGNGKGLDQMDDIWLALREVRRMEGKGRTPDFERSDERKVLQTVITENMRKYFPLDEPWTDASPWDPDRKRIAVSQMGLSGDEKAQFKELELYHRRFLAASIHAQVTERGRPLGVQTNRKTMTDFVLAHVGPDIKVERDATTGVVTEGAWGPAEKRDFIKKYSVTPKEADEMRKRALELAYDTDGTKIV